MATNKNEYSYGPTVGPNLCHGKYNAIIFQQRELKLSEGVIAFIGTPMGFEWSE